MGYYVATPYRDELTYYKNNPDETNQVLAVYDDDNVYSFAMTETDKIIVYKALNLPSEHTGTVYWAVEGMPIITVDRGSGTSVVAIPNPEEKRLIGAAKGAYLLLHHNFTVDELEGHKVYRNDVLYTGKFDSYNLKTVPNDIRYVLTSASAGDKITLTLADGSSYTAYLRNI